MSPRQTCDVLRCYVAGVGTRNRSTDGVATKNVFWKIAVWEVTAESYLSRG